MQLVGRRRSRAAVAAGGSCRWTARVRTAWLDADRGFFNGTSLCLRVEGPGRCAHVLELVAPDGLAGWGSRHRAHPQRST